MEPPVLFVNEMIARPVRLVSSQTAHANHTVKIQLITHGVNTLWNEGAECPSLCGLFEALRCQEGTMS